MYEGLKEYLEEKGYSQQKIADILGVSVPYVNAILVGPKTLGKKGAKKWANLFGLSENYLLTGNGQISPNGEYVDKYTSHIDAIIAEKDDKIVVLEKELEYKEGQIDSLNRELCAVRGESRSKDKTIEAQDGEIRLLKRQIEMLELENMRLRNESISSYPFEMGVSDKNENVSQHV